MNNHQKLSIVICLALIPIFIYGLNHWLRKDGAVRGETVAIQPITPTLTPPLTGTTTVTSNPSVSLLTLAYTPAPVGNSAHAPTPTPTVRITTTPAINPTGIFTTSTPVPTTTPIVIKGQMPTLSPTPTPTPTPRFSNTPTPTPKLTNTPIPTSTPTPRPTSTPTPRPTNTPTPTPIPTSTPVPTPTLTYQQANGPRLVTWTDSVGNTFSNSFNYYYQGWEQGMIASTAVSIGSHPTMSFTIIANDPNGRPIQYEFETSGSGGQIQNYSSNNSYTANVIGSPGTYFRVVAKIKNDDAYVSYDSGGMQIDAEWFIDYNLVP